jgi:anti-anti-sigma factor
MVCIARGWELDVERGPDWLLVRPRLLSDEAESAPPLAEQIWGLLEQHMTHRLVLELDGLNFLGSYLVGQLVWLHKRICTHGGLMRICGLSPANQEVLHICRLDGRFPQYHDRTEAIMGDYRPGQPR